MITRQVGDRTVGAVGLGAMMFGFIGAEHDEASRRTLHTAFDAGMTLVDTARVYTNLDEPSHGERVVAEAVATSDVTVHVATKGGHWRDGERWAKDGRPETIRAHCEHSLKTLGVDSLWLYQLHWPDPDVPVEESMGAFADLQREGKVQHVGASNFDLDQLAAVAPVVQLASVQNSFSIVRQDDRPVLDHCAREGIAYLAYSPLGGSHGVGSIAEQVPALATVGEARGLSPQQVALAWLLAQSPTVVPLAGCSRVESVLSSAAVMDVELTAEELALLDA